MVYPYLKHKHTIKQHAKHILEGIENYKLTMGILLNKTQSLLPVKALNDVYKICAKRTLSEFKETLETVKPLDLSPVDKYINDLVQVNKYNTHHILKGINEYKADKTKRAKTSKTYLKSLDNLSSVVRQAESEIVTELTELTQLQNLKVK